MNAEFPRTQADKPSAARKKSPTHYSKLGASGWRSLGFFNELGLASATGSGYFGAAVVAIFL